MIQKNFKIKPDEAQNGQIAIEMYERALNLPCKCQNRVYKLILMDIQMPVMDGFKASERIIDMMKKCRNQDKCQSSNCLTSTLQQDKEVSNSLTDIVALTAYVSDESIKRCLSIGMRKVLSKPVTLKQLNEVMQLYFYRISKDEYRQKQSLAKQNYMQSVKKS